MKRAFFLLMAVVAVGMGCKSDEPFAGSSGNTDGRRPLVLTTVSPKYTGGEGVRTEMRGLDVIWNNGDKVALVDTDDMVHVFENTEADGSIARFATDLMLSADNRVEGAFSGIHTVVYPASQDYRRGDTNTKVQGIRIADSQPLLANNFGRDCNVSFAGLNTQENYNGDNLAFYNACGLLCVRLRGDVRIKSVMITAPEGSVVAGSGTIDYAQGGFINDNASLFTGTRTVTLEAENGVVQLGEDVVCFYACVVPARTYTCDGSGITANLVSTNTGAKAGTYKITFINDRNERIATTAILEKDVCAGRISTLGQYNIRYGKLDMDPTGRNIVEITPDSGEGTPVTNTRYEGEDTDWLEVGVGSDAITFRAEVNISGKERFATVEITVGSTSYEVQVCQKSVASLLSLRSFGCDVNACQSEPVVMPDYIADFLGGWSLESDADWFSVTRTGNRFTISAPENTTGADRTGNILIKDAGGAVVTTLPVCQTHFSFDDLLGVHVLKFGDGNYWLMDFIAENGGFAVKAIGYDGIFKTVGYGLKFDYVAAGDRAPKMVLGLPQSLGVADGKELMLYATSSDGYFSLTENLGYDLAYSGNKDRISFDFTTEYDAYDKGFDDGFVGLFFLRGMTREDWIVPGGEQECLRLLKWGYGNHDDFEIEID